MGYVYLCIPFFMYFFPNLLTYIQILYLNVMLVDMVPVFVSASYKLIFLCFFSLVASLSTITLLANFFEKKYFGGSFIETRQPKILGYFVFFTQICTFFAALYFDYGRAGSKGGDVSIVGIVISYLHADTLFILYYTHARENIFPKYNLALFVASNVTRGWGGVWLVIFMIESFYFLRRGDLKRAFFKIAIITFVAIAAYPFANTIKEQARGAETGELVYFESYVKLFNRMQHLSNVIMLAQESEAISNDVESGVIIPWYINNPIFMRLLSNNNTNTESLQKYATSRYLIDFSKVGDGYYVDDLSWYTNTGFSGWLFLINFYAIPLYIAYALLMMWLPYWIIGRFIGVASMVPALHVASFLYVFHGWMDVQFSFIITVLVYVFIYKFFVPQNFARR